MLVQQLGLVQWRVSVCREVNHNGSRIHKSVSVYLGWDTLATLLVEANLDEAPGGDVAGDNPVDEQREQQAQHRALALRFLNSPSALDAFYILMTALQPEVASLAFPLALQKSWTSALQVQTSSPGAWQSSTH